MQSFAEGGEGTDEKRRAAERVRQEVLALHKKMFVEELNQLVKLLCRGGPALEKMPSKTTTVTTETKQKPEAKAKEISSSSPSSSFSSKKSSSSSSKSKGKSIEIREEFYCRPSDLWDCYMDEGRVRAYTRSDVRIVPKEGEAFSLFNGGIQGKQIELVKNEKVVQEWRSSSWPAGVFSRVVITFSSPSDGKTVMKLVQTGIPEEDEYGNSNTIEVTKQGWRMQIWGRVRQCFGYGC
jgi:activator of HSP90 ATPase